MTWTIKPEVIVYSDGSVTMDIPVDYESTTNKKLTFGIKSTDDENIQSFFNIEIMFTNSDDY